MSENSRIRRLKPRSEAKLKNFRNFSTFWESWFMIGRSFLRSSRFLWKRQWPLIQVLPYARQCRWNNPGYRKTLVGAITKVSTVVQQLITMGGKLTGFAWRPWKLVTLRGSKWQVPLRRFAMHYYVLFLVFGNSLLCNFFTIRPPLPIVSNGSVWTNIF